MPDIERIFKLTPFTRQTLFFSATMPPEIQRVTNQFLQNPVQIEVARRSTTAETVEQKLCPLPSDDARAKRAALRHLIDRCDDIKNGIIFCNRKRTVDIVARSLQKYEYNAAPIHGDLPQAYRTQTLERFRNGEIKLLIASDVAARGLDIPDVSHVFNFDAPIHAEDYVHRIGRTGRAGRSGAAFMLSTPSDEKFIAAIKTEIGKDIDVLELEGLAPPAQPAERKEAPRERRERGSRTGRRRRSQDEEAAKLREEASITVENAIDQGDHIPAFLLRGLPKAENSETDERV